MIRSAGNIIRQGYRAFSRWRNYANSRTYARQTRETIAKHNGGSCVTAKMISSMKSEMKVRFGDEGHWPWIALYTELRGEYIKGWVPDDHYAYGILPFLNTEPGPSLSTIKTYDHRLYPGFAINPLALRISGTWFDSEMEKMTSSNPIEFLQSLDREVVIKRDRAPSGRDITFKHSSDITDKDFYDTFDYLIQPSVRQHPSLASLHRESISTIRITTFLKSDGTVEVKHQTIRFGIKADRVVNTSGLFVFLDDDGRVISNARDDLGLDRGNKHPDTGFTYKNLQVPSMHEAKQACKEAHLTFPYLRFIAWDVYIDENAIPRMIEWNARRPDMWVNEALIGPLWDDELVDLIPK